MDRREFLEGLRSYLEPEVSAEIVRDNINYYERYITEEVIKGRREEAVVEELGDPWVIAKTIIDMQENAGTHEEVYESTFEENRDYGRVRTVKFDSFWKKLLLILVVIGIIFLVISIITGIIGLLAPIAIPVLLVVTIYNFFKRRS